MKFKDPKTGDVVKDINQVYRCFCFWRNCDTDCPLNVPRDCESWVLEHPAEAAHLMGYEIIDKEDQMEKMDKPRICEMLGVEVGEWFRIKGLKNVQIRIVRDGTFTTNPSKAPGSCAALLLALEHPDRIIRKPRFTQEEVELIKMFQQACTSPVTIERTSGNLLVWRTKKTENSKMEHLLPVRLFSSLRPCQSVTLKDILEDQE